jgi:hypothetical protein
MCWRRLYRAVRRTYERFKNGQTSVERFRGKIFQHGVQVSLRRKNVVQHVDLEVVTAL